jgi:hypothetical protein
MHPVAFSLHTISLPERTVLRSLLLSLSALLLVPQAALGYGAKGHRIAGEVAELYLCREARAELKKIAPNYNLAEAGLWADRIRSIAAWDKARTWHYINVPDGMTLSETPRLQTGDVLSSIKRFRAELADTSLTTAQRREAFLFLVHFIVDAHQPLHVGRRSDRGGNKIDVRVNDRSTTLHQYWDTLALDPLQQDPPAIAADLVRRYGSSAWQWQAFTPELWVIESQAFRPEVYDFARQNPASGRVTLDEAYQARALQISEFRLAQAGIRLAATLNGIWCWDSSDGQPRPLPPEAP